MALLCTGCYEQKKHYNIEMKEPYHPYHVGNCDVCKSNVVEVDDMMVDTIEILNKKGWKTKFCCSGHLEESFLATYIYFENRPEEIPFGFYVSDMGSIHLISRDNPKGIEGYQKLLNVNIGLFKWATNLPQYEEVK